MIADASAFMAHASFAELSTDFCCAPFFGNGSTDAGSLHAKQRAPETDSRRISCAGRLSLTKHRVAASPTRASFCWRARRRAFQRQTRLSRVPPRATSWSGFRRVIHGEPARHPIQHVRPQPADLTATEPPLLRKSPEQDESGKNQLWPARQPRDVVSAEELLKGRKGFIDPG